MEVLKNKSSVPLHHVICQGCAVSIGGGRRSKHQFYIHFKSECTFSPLTSIHEVASSPLLYGSFMVGESPLHHEWSLLFCLHMAHILNRSRHWDTLGNNVFPEVLLHSLLGYLATDATAQSI